jgi:hypothetical protein
MIIGVESPLMGRECKGLLVSYQFVMGDELECGSMTAISSGIRHFTLVKPSFTLSY